MAQWYASIKPEFYININSPLVPIGHTSFSWRRKKKPASAASTESATLFVEPELPKNILPQDGKRNVLITSALPYVNNVPHLGTSLWACATLKFIADRIIRCHIFDKRDCVLKQLQEILLVASCLPMYMRVFVDYEDTTRFMFVVLTSMGLPQKQKQSRCVSRSYALGALPFACITFHTAH